MNKLTWHKMPRPPLHMEMWLASYRNTISFAILHDKIGIKPEYSGFIHIWRDMRDDNQGPTKIEGPYDSLEEAQDACEKHLDRL